MTPQPARRSSIVLLALLGLLAPGVASAQKIDCGETLTRTIALAYTIDDVTFAARTGEVVSITAVPAPDQSFRELRWLVFDIFGDLVWTTGGETCAGQCETLPLPTDGVFTIVAFDVGSGRGTYHLTLEAVSATANKQPNGPPDPACARKPNGQPDGTRVIDAGKEARGSIDVRGETDTFTFLADQGEVLDIAVGRLDAADAWDPQWELFDPKGARVPMSDGASVCNGRCRTDRLRAAGTHTIKVSDTGHDGVGSYTLLLAGDEPVTTTTTTTSTTTTTTEPTTTTTETTTTTTTTEPTTTTTTEPTTTTTETTTTTTTTEPTTTTTETTTTTSTTETTTTTLPEETSTTTPTTSTTTTTEAPSETQPFELDLTVRGEGPALAPPGEVGAAVAVSGDRLVLGAPHDDSGVSDGGAVYVVDVGGAPGSGDFGTLLDTLVKPGAPAAGDEFGAAVATAAAGVVVGAPGDDSAAPEAGAAYLFPAGAAAPVALVAPVAEPGARLGTAAAALGDDLVVGAPGATAGGTPGAGKAYLFRAATGEPLLTYEHPGPDGPNDAFGFALAAVGDNLLVGAPGTPDRAGKAFLLEGGTGRLLLTLEGPSPAAGDQFGFSVAAEGDDLLVGAPGRDGSAGAVYRFDGATGTLTRSFGKPTPTPGDRLGEAIAATELGLLVGVPGDSAAAGAACLFDVGTGTLKRVFRASGTEPGDAAGSAVSVVGGRVLLGIPHADIGTIDGGAAYLLGATGGVEVAFRRRLTSGGLGSALIEVGTDLVVGAPGGGIVQRVEAASGTPVASLESPAGGDGRFGFAVAAPEGVLAIGAPFEDERSGAVYLFEGSRVRARLTNPSPLAGDQFGFALAAAGTELFVGAPLAGPRDTGIVHVFDAASGTRRATFQKPTPVAGDFFGAAVAADADGVLVGAPFDGSVAANAGAVYLFRRASAELEGSLTSPAPAVGDLFGAAVGLGRTLVAVGAPLADAGSVDAGRVFVFDRAARTLRVVLENPRAGSGDEFGHAVAVVGERILVGAPLADGHAADTGAAYLFDGTTGALLETLLDPPQGAFDEFGFSVAAEGERLLIGSPGSSRVYRFEATGAAVVTTLGVRALAAPAAAGTQCGNGIVEGAETCDDGNDVDLDDCRNDCTAGPCCTLDPLGAARCDDGSPCTDDRLDPVGGCTHVPNGSCCAGDAQCPGAGCRLCVGCFLYPWDCCDRGSTCLARSPQCVGTSCIPAALCECEGGLACADQAVHPTVTALFTGACDQLRLEQSVAPQEAVERPLQLRSAKLRTHSARALIRKAAKATRKLTSRGAVSKSCRTTLLTKIRAVKRAIPGGKRLRRCVLATPAS